jgi:hypothetical protein
MACMSGDEPLQGRRSVRKWNNLFHSLIRALDAVFVFNLFGCEGSLSFVVVLSCHT